MTWKRDPDQHLHPNVPQMPVVAERSDDRKTLTLDREIPAATTKQNIELVHFKYWSCNRARVVETKGTSITVQAPVGIQDAWYTKSERRKRLLDEMLFFLSPNLRSQMFLTIE